MRWRGEVVHERGQAAVEFAFAIPLVILMAFTAIECAWTMYCGNCLTSAAENVRYSVTAADEATGNAAADIIKDRLVADQPVLGTGTLDVSGAEIRVYENEARSVDLPDEDFEEYMIATGNHRSKRVEVKAQVEYTMSGITGVLGESRFSRTIDVTAVTDETFELG